MRLMQRGGTSRKGFTLIEILIVIVIISILAGIVFKMMIYVGRSSNRAATIATLERVAMALAEFKAEYGQYPPCNTVAYEYENVEQQKEGGMYDWLNKPENLSKEDQPTLFSYGLVSYLWPRIPEGSHIEHTDHPDWIGDTDRDVAAKARWAPFLADLTLQPAGSTYTNATVEGGQKAPYANSGQTLWDAWGEGHEIKYESVAPYQTYRLWSTGDGVPINLNSWDN